MSINSGNSNFRYMNVKNQMIGNAKDLKMATSTLNSLFTQLLSAKNDEIRKKLLKQLNQVVSGMTALMKDLNSFKTLLNLGDQKLLDALSETFDQYFLDLKYLTLEKSSTFEDTLNALHNNVLNYTL